MISMLDHLKKLWLYLSAFAAGGVILAVEILGTRLMAPFFGSTIFVWTSMIIVTLGALALGYLAGGKLIDRFPRPSTLSLVLFLGGISVFLPVRISQWALLYSDRFGIERGPLAAAAILFILPLALLATTSPMVIRLLLQVVQKAGSRAGAVFAVSTVGSVAGALLAGFYLLPIYSVSQIFNACGILVVLLAVPGFRAFDASAPGGIAKNFISGSAIAILAILAFSHIPYYEAPIEPSPALQVLKKERGYYGDIMVADVAGAKCIFNDGTTQSCMFRQGEGYENPLLWKELGSMINSSGAKNVLVLGTGGGNLAREFEASLEADLVDIDPAVVRLGQEFLGFIQGPNQKLAVDDARHFLASSDKKYDFIYIDLFKGYHPPYWVFSREGFETIKDRLSGKGLVAIFLMGGSGEKDKSTASVVKTAREVFPGVELRALNPEENTAFLVFLSSDPGFEYSYKPRYGFEFEETTLDESDGVVLADDKNPLDIFFVQKSESWLKYLRNYVGIKALL